MPNASFVASSKWSRFVVNYVYSLADLSCQKFASVYDSSALLKDFMMTLFLKYGGMLALLEKWMRWRNSL